MTVRALVKSISPFVALVVVLYFLITWLLIADKNNDMEWVYISEVLVTIITIVTVIAAVNRVNFLHLLNNRQDLLIDYSPAKNVLYDFQKDKFYLSETAAKILGLSHKKRLKLSKFLKLFSLEDQQEIDYIISKSELSTQFEKVGLIKIHKEDEEIFLQYKCQLFIDRFGHKLLSFWFTDYTSVVTDELELVSITKKYRISSFELGQMLELIPIPIWRRNEVGAVIFENKECDNIMHKYNIDFNEPSILEVHKKAMENNTIRSSSKRFILHDNIDVLSFFEIPMSDKSGTVGYCLNISDQDRQSAAIKAFESVISKLVDNISVGFITLDKEHRVVKYNNAFLNMFALDATLMDKKPNYRYVLEVMRDNNKLSEIRGFKDKHLKDIREVRDCTVDLLHAPNGITIKFAILPSQDGQTILTFENMTPSLEIERELNKSKLMLHSVIGIISEPVLIISQNGQINYINKEFINNFFIDTNQTTAPAHISKLFSSEILRLDSEDINSIHKTILNCLESKNCSSHTIIIDNKSFKFETLGLDDLSVMLIARANKTKAA
jgi:PAS domain-containing protein